MSCTLSGTGIANSTVTYSDRVHSSEQYSGVKRRKPQGWMPPTNYYVHSQKHHRARGLVQTRDKYLKVRKYEGCVGGMKWNSLNRFDSICSRYTTGIAPMNSSAAIVAARAKLKAYNVDLGLAFAERNATARGLGDTAKRIALAVRELRRGHFRNAARQLGITHDVGKPRGSNWTNHWLQLQYGWKPLLSDVYGAVDALKGRDKSDWRVTAKAYRSDEDTYSNGDSTYAGSAVRRRGVFVRLDALPSNDLTMSLSSLGVLNPLAMVWETLPYSFVVDWALPIGNWLDSLDALLGYTDCYQSVTTYTRTVWTTKALEVPTVPPAYYINEWDDEWAEMFYLDRTATSGAPIPPLPRIKDPRSLGHMANGLALMSQAFGR